MRAEASADGAGLSAAVREERRAEQKERNCGGGWEDQELPVSARLKTDDRDDVKRHWYAGIAHMRGL